MSDSFKESEEISLMREELINFLDNRETVCSAKIVSYCLLTLGSELIELCWGEFEEDKVKGFIRNCIDKGKENAYAEGIGQ